MNKSWDMAIGFVIIVCGILFGEYLKWRYSDE